MSLKINSPSGCGKRGRPKAFHRETGFKDINQRRTKISYLVGAQPGLRNSNPAHSVAKGSSASQRNITWCYKQSSLCIPSHHCSHVRKLPGSPEEGPHERDHHWKQRGCTVRVLPSATNRGQQMNHPAAKLQRSVS